MADVTVSKTVKAPVEKVFSIWNDEFGDIYKFNPNLKDSYLLDDSPSNSGLGALRQCDLADGKNWIREKVISATQNKQIVIDIYEGTMPLKSAKATFDFVALPHGVTKVSMTMSFIPKGGFLGLLIVPLLSMKFRGMLSDLLDSNAAYAERGVQFNPTRPVAA